MAKMFKILRLKPTELKMFRATHNVHYFSYADSINIEHIANNRSGLAAGAVNAALWLIDNKGYLLILKIFSFSITNSKQVKKWNYLILQ